MLYKYHFGNSTQMVKIKPPGYQPDGSKKPINNMVCDMLLPKQQNYIIHPPILQIDEGVFFVPFFKKG